MPPTPLRKTLWTVRYGVPIGLALIGVVILAIERSTTGVEAWGMFTGAAGAVLLLNGLYRIGARDADRDEEESAREHFAVHGDWPATVQAGGREWTLPVGVVTLEAEQAANAARVAADTAGVTPAGAPPDAQGRLPAEPR